MPSYARLLERRAARALEGGVVAAVEPPPAAFVAWARRYFPHYFTALPASDVHDWLAKHLEAMEAGARLCVLAPRGEAKSTWVSLLFVLWCAARGVEPYIWVCSDTQPQTRTHLINIRWECEGNEDLIAAYPGVFGNAGAYSADQITLGNGVIIQGLSTGQNLRGRRVGASRPSLIILDDPEGEQDAISPTRRDHNREWFDNALLKAGEPATKFILLGTAVCPDCLALQVAARPGWRSRIFKAVVEWPERMDLWEHWKALYLHSAGGSDEAKAEAEAKADAYFLANRAAMCAGHEVTWPARYPLEALMKEWAENPLSFAKERQNDPHNPDACEWPAEFFDWDGEQGSFWFNDWPDEICLRVMALDPSKGKDAHEGDYSAYTMLCLGSNGYWYVEADLMRRPVTRIVSDGLALMQRFTAETEGPLDGMVIEYNGFQDLVGELLVEACRKEKVILPVYPFNNLIDKNVRIRRLTSPLNRRLLRFRRTPGTRMLVQQLKEFPVGAHRDGPDSLEMGMRLGAQLWEGKRAK